MATKFKEYKSSGAFSFAAKGTKEKAWRKENAALSGLCAPSPHHLLEKVDEN